MRMSEPHSGKGGRGRQDAGGEAGLAGACGGAGEGRNGVLACVYGVSSPGASGEPSSALAVSGSSRPEGDDVRPGPRIGRQHPW
jgi:hypothetical protein